MPDLPLRKREFAEDIHEQDKSDDEDDELNETGYKTVKDAVLFAIDVSKSMLRRPQVSNSRKADSSTPLEAALKCAYHLMQQRIISAPKDLMGILLYGTAETKFYEDDGNGRGGWGFPNCYLLTDLDIPEAEDVKALKSLVEQDNGDEIEDDDSETGNEKSFKNELARKLFVPAKEQISMHTVLFCANQIFQRKASNFSSRRLFIVTDNDHPHKDNKNFASQATVRAKDLYDLGVIIELFPISTTRHDFDTKLFWDDIVYKSSPSDPDAIIYNPAALTDIDKAQLRAGTTDGISLLQSLLSEISSRAVPKRALFSSAALELSPNLKIGVKGFLLYKHQIAARQAYIYVGGDRPQIVKGQTAMYVDDSEGGAKTVEKVEIKKAYSFGGQQVTFSTDEMKKIRDFGTPIIRLLGFKPMDCFPFWANIKSSTFIYPFEDDYVGSIRVYSALYQKMRKDNLLALTWFIPRRNAAPVLAVLVPSLSADPDQERGSAVSVSGAPQGLHLIPLPFADDLRQHPPQNGSSEPVRAPDELVDKFRSVIQQLHLPKGQYDPHKYANPALQWHYRILQAIALEEDLPEEPEDKTLPKFKQIDRRAGDFCVEWGNYLEKAYKELVAAEPYHASIGDKRSINGGSRVKAEATNGAMKKIKSETGGGPREDDVRKLFKQGQIDKMTVADLKEFAAAKGLAVSGKKADLVERIEGWFENR